jgi:glycosyltransferase involved in cell wall biosynthesis
MPVLNEERHLADAVTRILEQDYPGELEVIIALGPSRDGTDRLSRQLSEDDPRVRTVRNPSGRTPAGLNAAIAASRHPIIVRVDGHGLLTGGYVRTAVHLLEETGADNVGGVMAATGVTPFEKAVAAAMRSRLGVGNAPFHVGGSSGPADTVYLGVFRRETLERLGGYDECFQRAQDWELNLRIREAGGLVWFSPALEVTYRPRSNLRALAGQYFHYGRWRRVVMRQHPGTASLRYLAPPAAVLAVGAGVAGSLLHRSTLLVPGGYAGALVAGSLVTGRQLPLRSLAVLPLVYATMHLCWGAGFLSSPRGLLERPDLSPVRPGPGLT